MVVVALALAVTAGCGSDASSSHLATSGAPTTSTTVATSTTLATTTSAPRRVNGLPHFDTPEDAMRYLAAAWNANDLVSLRHVTDPSARDELDAMHGEASNLRLERCEPRVGVGDYTCTFAHDYPPGASTTVPKEQNKGEAVFLVGPADTPGWYMTVFESCG